MNGDSPSSPQSERTEVTALGRPHGLQQTLHDQKRNAYCEAILDAAQTVFLRDGFQASKVSEIAETVGVSVGTLYRYFPSKQAMFYALAERHRQRYFLRMSEPYETSLPLEQLTAYVQRCLDFVENNGLLFGIYLESTCCIRSGDDALPAIDPKEDWEHSLARLEAIVKRAVAARALRGEPSSREMAWTLQTLLWAAIHDWAKDPIPGALLKRGQGLLCLLLQGAKSS